MATEVRVVGAGVGRTGTRSLKDALEVLLSAPCYHMLEVFAHPDHPARWRRAVLGEPVDLAALLDGYAAIVDWPGAACWRELADTFPDAVVLLSARSSAEAWHASAAATIFAAMEHVTEDQGDWEAMAAAMMDRFDPAWRDPAAAKAAYERHNAEVRAAVGADRLVEWQPGDGWEPLCAALGVPVPDEPFPHRNTTAEFREQFGV